MGNRILITETEKKQIRKFYNLNENIIKKLISSFTNSGLYKKVEKAFSEDVNTFVNNIVKEIPKLSSVKDKLRNNIEELSKMSDEEAEKYVQTNYTKTKDELDSVEQTLNEQFDGGLLLVVIFVIGVLYLVIKSYIKEKRGISKGEMDKIQQEMNKGKNEILKKTFLRKKMNLYRDPELQYINNDISPFIILWIEFIQLSNGQQGILIRGDGPNPERKTDNLVAICKSNPNEFDSAMGVFTKDGNVNKSKLYYNENFTKKLNEVGRQWCSTPRADFGKKDIK